MEHVLRSSVTSTRGMIARRPARAIPRLACFARHRGVSDDRCGRAPQSQAGASKTTTITTTTPTTKALRRSNSWLAAQCRKYSLWGGRKNERQKGVDRVLLTELYHPFSRSPIEAMRRKASIINTNSYCPHPDHMLARMNLHAPPDNIQRGDLPPAHSSFECPDCGIPLYCCKEHWQDDYEAHLEVCDTLRQINEDEHDLHSGRIFPEFEYAPPLFYNETVINMSSWDVFLFTREFEAINSERSMRQVTRLLTYPITIASILHEHSPYDLRDRLTPEGLKSMSALRYNLHPPPDGAGPGLSASKLKAPPVRIFVLGARAESSLPRDAWCQLACLFPNATIHMIFIGPEAMANRDHEFPLPERSARNPFGELTEDQVFPNMKFSTIVDYYHTIHKAEYFQPFDPYFDCFVLFHPGLGHPASSNEWAETLPYLLETKVPIIATGYTEFDLKRDLKWVHEQCKGEFDILLEPGENLFRSLRWDLDEKDPTDITCGNYGVWAFRGKRYEAIQKHVL